MSALSVFRDLTQAGSRLKFYTKETKEDIPSLPGCYAWFLPLWFYSNDLDVLIQTISEVLAYEPEPNKTAELAFTWETVDNSIRRRPKLRKVDQAVYSTWDSIIANADSRSALQQTLLEASLFAQPLYVGRSSSLRRRYLEHTGGVGFENNDFHKRLRESVKSLGLKVAVRDLLFVCITTPQELKSKLDRFGEGNVEKLTEHLLMQFCRPPFSLR